MQIFVRGLGAGAPSLTLDVASGDTVASVMAAVEERNGVPSVQQRLFSGRGFVSPRAGRTLGQCGIGPDCTLQLLLSGGLSGGGGDGGSTCNDRLWVEMRADISAGGTSWEKAVKTDQSQINAAQATGCAISSMELVEPVVCCELGHLYTKQALIEALMASKAGGTMPEKAVHVTSTSEMIDVKLTSREDAAGQTKADGSGGRVAYQGSRFQCPVTMRDMNGTNKFAVIRTSGVALSMEAIRELSQKGSGGVCPVTGTSFDPANDVIVLYPSAEELDAAKARMKARKKTLKKEKKAAKKEKKAAAAADARQKGTDGGSAEAEVLKMKYLGKKEKIAVMKAAAGVNETEQREVSKRKAAQFSMDKVQAEASGNLKRTLHLTLQPARSCMVALSNWSPIV
jgi:hypothetical protein